MGTTQDRGGKDVKASKGENLIFLTLAKFYIPIFYFFNLNHVFPPKSVEVERPSGTPCVAH